MEKTRMIPQIQVRTQVRSGQGGGWVAGVFYPDRSGVCNTSNPVPLPQPLPTPIPPQPQPPTAGGGWVAGVWYPDRSGIC